MRPRLPLSSPTARRVNNLGVNRFLLVLVIFLLFFLSSLFDPLIHVVALVFSPAIACSIREWRLKGATGFGWRWGDPEVLSTQFLSSRRSAIGTAFSPSSFAQNSDRPVLNCSSDNGIINVKVLRWYYQDAPRFPLTDSQETPSVSSECASWCRVSDLQDARIRGLKDPTFEDQLERAHLILLSPHDHGRAFTNTWCNHPYPKPFVDHLARPKSARWGAFTYENIYQFPMLGDFVVSNGVDMTVNYRQDSDVPVSWMCSEDGGSFSSDYFRLPRVDKPYLVSLVASRCRNDWHDYVTALDRRLPAKTLVKYGKCFENSRAIPCYNKSSNNLCVSGYYEDKIAELSKSMFVLVFENTRGIRDYVTEKLSHALLAGTVPVIWGAPNVVDWLPHRDCCIVVSGTVLESRPEELARLLLYYKGNHEEYLKRFFAWKQEPMSPQFRNVVNKCVKRSGCRLCDWVRSQCPK